MDSSLISRHCLLVRPAGEWIRERQSITDCPTLRSYDLMSMAVIASQSPTPVRLPKQLAVSICLFLMSTSSRC
jgi:hypothetical protein